MPKRAQDITGFRSGFLTAISYAGSDGKKSLWTVRCDCGKTIIMPASELKKGKQKSCGCMRNALISKSRSTHTMSGAPIWAVWHSMKQRCENPTAQAWRNYGGRGIKVCERWSKSFDDFYSDMGSAYKKGLTLDRIDVNGDYTPENCRWTTMKNQARNKRGNRFIESPWGRITVAEAAERSGIGATTLLYRLGHGWPTDLLFITPDVRNRCMTL